MFVNFPFFLTRDVFFFFTKLAIDDTQRFGPIVMIVVFHFVAVTSNIRESMMAPPCPAMI